MLPAFLGFLQKFADISKMHGQQCTARGPGQTCTSKTCWQHSLAATAAAAAAAAASQQAAKQCSMSHGSDTSSGCDSSSSSTKENSYLDDPQRHQQQQHHSFTPQQLQQLRQYQRVQQQQLELLQRQILQRRLLLHQLQEEGVPVRRPSSSRPMTLTCNQQYLLQQRHQQQQNLRHPPPNNNSDNNKYNNNQNNNFNISDLLNNNHNNYNNNVLNNLGLLKGQKPRRGMTEFSTNNDQHIANKTHLTQPLHPNSPRHFPHTNSPQHYNNAPYSSALASHHHSPTHQHTINPQQQQLPQHHNHTAHNHKNNQQTLQVNSSANLLLNQLINSPASPTSVTPLHATTAATATTTTAYKKPLNSPNNTPLFAYGGAVGYYNTHERGHNTATTAAAHQQLLRNSKLPLLTHTQYHQHLNDLLVQQQSLQQHQQQVLRGDNDAADGGSDELSEESLKQNVAIVLNNLDRYNNALRSIILNEQVSTNSSSVLFGGGGASLADVVDGGYGDDVDDDDNLLLSSNNNFLLSGGGGGGNRMAAPTPATPESDYNSNATTPGSRAAGIVPQYDSNMMTAHQQHQQHQQQHKLVGATAGGGGGVHSIANGLGGAGGGGGGGNGGGAGGNNLNCSLASSHDFTHDNSDYQWFLDYGYRDGCSGMQRSVLSSLSGSYNGLGDLIYYDDLARNLDANLAEVDMESFRAEDIHSLLSQLPSYCKSLGSDTSRLQQSLMLQQLQQQQYTIQQQQQQLQHQQQHQQQMYHNMPGNGGLSHSSIMSANEMIDNSICKSELLFSPVKESQYSVDSLDMDAYPEDGDIILTCKANKDNYTIAFEGSVLYSDDSFYAEPSDLALRNKQNFINLHSNLEDIVKRKPLEVSMTRSEQACCQQLQRSHNPSQLQRYPSGNNNTSDAISTLTRHSPQCAVRKSNSMPNLSESAPEECCLPVGGDDQDQMPNNAQLNVSQAISTSTVGGGASAKARHNLLPMCQMPMSANNSTSASISEHLEALSEQQPEPGHHQHQHHHNHHHHHHHRRKATHHCCSSHGSGGSSSGGDCSCGSATLSGGGGSGSAQKHSHISGSASSGNSNPPASINLVKLFIKQKSTCHTSSHENQASSHTCMDVSSGCWPSSDAAASSSSSSLEQRLRKKSMNDSGKGSALSRHDEEDMLHEASTAAGHSTPKKQYATARTRNEAATNGGEADQSSSSSGSLTATNSPAHRRRSMPLRNPQLSQLAMQQLHQHSGSTQSSDGLDSRSNSEQITQVFNVAATTTGGGRPTAESLARVSHASSSEMITRSMQTSCGGSLSSRSSLSERFRCVPPSFLAKLNTLAQDSQAPIYVIYPNYALPDLGFVKANSPPSGDVIFSPFNYKTAVASGSSGTTSSTSLFKKRLSMGENEDEILKTLDYKHVSDWQSLATLLPPEYRRRLQHIPAVAEALGSLESELSQKPMFCMSPPLRRSRTHLCDCAQLFQATDSAAAKDAQQEGSSSSGSSHPPSSGYRGSSTLLTDSELEHTADPLKQMYVYQYDQQQRPDSVAPPVPMPRGILRKSASSNRSKRNSMIEQQQQTRLSKLEKRRSLQEPPYHAMSSAEELCDVFEEEDDDETLYAAIPSRRVPVPAGPRLSRKDMDARARAENFLSSVPRSELKYYAEIAAILETSSDHHPDMVPYDAAALKKEVSRVLSQQKKVSFHDVDVELMAAPQPQAVAAALPAEVRQRFATPPNSPNISMATTQAALLEEKDKRKIESNRFKRLQIQWELMSKDSSMLKELANDEHTKSGGSTPTSANAHKSRIPRPVSYPAGRITAQDGGNGKAGAATRSPSRIKPPKRYSMTSAPTATPTMAKTPSPVTTPSGTATRSRTPNSRAAVTAPSTPKRRVQSPRNIPRVR